MNQDVEEQHDPSGSAFPMLTPRLKVWWVNHRELVTEWYRIYFHTILVTLLLIMNLWLGFSSFLIFFAQWFGIDSGVIGFLTLFYKNPPIGYQFLLNGFYTPLHHHKIFWIVFALNLPILTWIYSTISQPIKKGFKTYLTWVSPKGRIAMLILCAIPFALHVNAIFAWYIRNYLFDFFAGIKSNEQYLVVNSMESFGYVLLALPLIIVIFSSFLIVKDFYSNEDLKDAFFKWKFKWLASQAFSLRDNSCDVIVGWSKETNEPIVLTEKNRYLHELVAGATGTGKTSTTILIRIVQDLIRIARGRKMGIIVLEPKGDLVADVLTLCDQLGVPKHIIKVIDPTNIPDSIKFSPFVGPMDAAAETFRGVLDALTENQDSFFKGQQGETSGLYTLLGKIRYGHKFNILHLQRMFTDPRHLADITEEVREQVNSHVSDENISEDVQLEMDRYDRIVSYFETEVLDYKQYKEKDVIKPQYYPDAHKHAGKQVVESKKDKYVAGAKKYLNDIATNVMLSKLMVAKDDEELLDLDAFLANGGVLVVNTALGELEELSLSFGQFFIRQLQSSIFRRPKIGRIPFFLYIDEAPLYINAAFERLFTLGRSYLVGTLIAMQSLGQFKVIKPGYDNTMMGSARSKTVFGGGEFEDNKRFSDTFGEEPQTEESQNESTTPISMPNQSWGIRNNIQRKQTARFTPTEIKELKFKHFIFDSMDAEGSVMPPIHAIGKFVSETKFVKRFLKIGNLKLLTEQNTDQEFDLTLTHSNLLSSLMEKPVKTDVDDILAQKQEEVTGLQEEPETILPTNALPIEEDLPDLFVKVKTPDEVPPKDNVVYLNKHMTQTHAEGADIPGIIDISDPPEERNTSTGIEKINDSNITDLIPVEEDDLEDLENLAETHDNYGGAFPIQPLPEEMEKSIGLLRKSTETGNDVHIPLHINSDDVEPELQPHVQSIDDGESLGETIIAPIDSFLTEFLAVDPATNSSVTESVARAHFTEILEEEEDS
ncbi:conjugation protein, TraG/TraD family [Paenibacillus sp. CFBP13512]|uniref:type IV secretory system conjugative DNA transfer family protein n=1 Tax=Paenibacillus sp. CFBP13512 TaxID=2184007 RepID=UPI0010C0CB3E|nr:TraM recognition domain-containing protein [Paenibacillus sp. CFBP13512]TKJ83846.1 conjugation protein, TraG/TraD family [Paenibacillus sp. CFBP13512]